MEVSNHNRFYTYFRMKKKESGEQRESVYFHQLSSDFIKIITPLDPRNSKNSKARNHVAFAISILTLLKA